MTPETGTATASLRIGTVEALRAEVERLRKLERLVIAWQEAHDDVQPTRALMAYRREVIGQLEAYKPQGNWLGGPQ